jgi:hypothetical protein
MPSPSASLFSALQSRYVRLDRTRSRVDALFACGKLVRFDIEQVYSGIYVEAFVSFERFVEDLFLGYVSGRVTMPTLNVKARMSFPSSAIAEEVVFGGKDYIDWIPYERTTERAGIFFKDGKPFSTLTKTQKEMLKELHRVRNALAHRSDHSVSVFTRLVLGTMSLSPHERKPAGFLRSVFRVSPKQTRLENYLFEMLTIAKELSQY